MSRAIVITSGKGGVGKSSLAVCIGRELAGRGKRVALIDTDIGLNNLDVIMNVENRVVYDLSDVMRGKCRLSQALTKDKVQESLFLLTSKGYRNESIPTEFLKKTVNTLLSRFDYVFIDCPAGIDVGFHRAIALAKEAIVVTTPHVSAIKDASSVIAILKSYSFTRIGYALNRVRGDMVVSLTMAEAKDVTEALEVQPIAIIPENDGINTLSSVGCPLKEGSDGARAIKVMCDNIENGTNTVIDLTKRYKGLWGAVRRLIKNKI
ncbi:MAG: septum site-determining protein MinD [Clostridiales bacterium]|nr:septum site-determining protein MinD [Clostridiales bacterium]